VLGRISLWSDAPEPIAEATARFPPRDTCLRQSGRAPSFSRTPFISMAISRILFPEFLRGDDHLSRPACAERPPNHRRRLYTAAIVWRDATIPEDLAPNFSGAGGPAALPLFCLAPHGVFPASALARRAVSSYLAFSPLPNERSRAQKAVCFLRHFPSRLPCENRARAFCAACCRLVFGLSSGGSRKRGTRQRSSAIVRKIPHSGTQVVTKKQSF
jgi:hypothetical protein